MQYFLNLETCFLEQVAEHNELKKMKTSLLNRVEKTIQKAKEHSEQFSEYSFLWVNNRKKFLGRSKLY